MKYYLDIALRVLAGKPLGERCITCRRRILGHAHTSSKLWSGARTVYRHYPACPATRRNPA